MSKHTPGPWTIDEHELGSFIRCAGGYIITGPVNERPGYKANARLIAAAPNLLEALMKAATALERVEHLIGGGDDEVSIESEILTARDAIAKATGGEG